MMKRKHIRYENKFECKLNCRFYNKCLSRNGNQCKHLGGKKIPIFKSLHNNDLLIDRRGGYYEENSFC